MMFNTKRPAAEPVSSDSATGISATPRRSNRSSSVHSVLFILLFQESLLDLLPVDLDNPVPAASCPGSTVCRPRI